MAAIASGGAGWNEVRPAPAAPPHWLGSAPISSKSRTTSTCPLTMAAINGVDGCTVGRGAGGLRGLPPGVVVVVACVLLLLLLPSATQPASCWWIAPVPGSESRFGLSDRTCLFTICRQVNEVNEWFFTIHRKVDDMAHLAARHLARLRDL